MEPVDRNAGCIGEIEEVITTSDFLPLGIENLSKGSGSYVCAGNWNRSNRPGYDSSYGRDPCRVPSFNAVIRSRKTTFPSKDHTTTNHPTAWPLEN